MSAHAARARTSVPPSSETLARFFDFVHEGIYFGTLRGDVDATTAANPHLKLMFGHPPDAEAAAVRPFEPERFVDADARAAFLERLARDRALADYLLRLRRADDTPFWVEVTAHIDAEPGNDLRSVRALIRDVSDRRRLEDQGRDLYHQLLQAEKLAALGQTVSGVAHELNNPLATILTWSERLSSRSLDEVTKRGITAILSESERAAKIVRNLLTFARKHHTTRAQIDVNQVVRETLSLRAYDQRVSNIQTIEALATGLPHVFADPHHVKQVLLNLIINAEQAMLGAHGRGTLVTRTWHDEERRAVVLEVNDDGPGVPVDVRAKIFDPFFTTKAVGKGTGLGLTVAYALVQEHGGRIRIESEPGQGASFFVEFPTDGTIGDPQPQPPRQGASRDVRSSRVLVVEDEPALATAVSEALTEAGFRVDQASDGLEALERFAGQSFDLLICDLKMPRMDGPELYRRVLDSSPELARRMVFVTGDVAGTDAEPFLEQTRCRWLAKPFRLAELLRVAREVADD